MAMFTLHRDYRFISAVGHSIQFVKDEPVYVPPALHRDVQAFGAVPTEEGVESVLGEEAAAPPEVPLEERHRQLLDAFKLLQDRNERGDFTGQGVPSIQALKKVITDFAPEKKEVENLWHQYLEQLNP